VALGHNVSEAAGPGLGHAKMEKNGEGKERLGFDPLPNRN
jgi:hypothetical protein